MGFALLVSLALMGFLSIPLITASFAKSMGRPYKKWFLIGALLPVISVIILFFLPDLSKQETN
ncbi:MAG: hypothetical protein K0S33_1608 [Bacteroidetes bacterium]|jgi:hypothetical protein|nr:hypothetical protein [Bacteroidota bacterium]